jgi:hypothetical protein
MLQSAMSSFFCHVLSEETRRDLEAINSVGNVICEAISAEDSKKSTSSAAGDFFFAATIVILARRSLASVAAADAPPVTLDKSLSQDSLLALNRKLLDSMHYFRFALGAYGGADVRALIDDMQPHWPIPTPQPTLVDVIRSKIDEYLPASAAAASAPASAPASASVSPTSVSNSTAPAPLDEPPKSELIAASDAANRAFADTLALALNVPADTVVLALAESERLLPAHVVIVDRERKEIIVAVRGTQHINDIVTDALMMTSEVEKYGRVHRGIAESTHQLFERLLPVIKQQLQLNPSFKRVVFTGHSLGAGCASLLALEMRDAGLGDGVEVACYAFAPPPFLSEEVAQSAKSLVQTFVCGDDFIPRASARGFVGLHRGLSLILERVGSDVDSSPVRRLMRLVALVSAAERDCSLGPDLVVRSLEKLADCRIEDMVFDPKLLDEMDELVRECERTVTSDSDVFTRFHLAGDILHLERTSQSSFLPRLIESTSACDTLHSRLAEAMLSDHLAAAYARALKSTHEAVQNQLGTSASATS